MTGRHPMKNGVTHTIFERERMTLKATTLPQVLSTAGYKSGIFGKWHLDEKPVEPTPQPVAQATDLIASKPAVSNAIPPTLQPTPEETRPTPSRQASLKFEDLPHISELPLAVQNQIPDLAFTTHIFVSDGGSFVIINNSSMSDGMSMGSGLVLESIVKEGVILSYRNRRFTLRSMESWTR